ncbi:hypothetical protein D9M70_562600 [compost metagenome]
MSSIAHQAGELTVGKLYRAPYPAYARLRREAPACYFPGTSERLVTHWTDCQPVGAKETLLGPSSSAGRPELRVMRRPMCIQ